MLSQKKVTSFQICVFSSFPRVYSYLVERKLSIHPLSLCPSDSAKVTTKTSVQFNVVIKFPQSLVTEKLFTRKYAKLTIVIVIRF